MYFFICRLFRKNDYKRRLALSCSSLLSVRPSAWNDSIPTGRIFVILCIVFTKIYLPCSSLTEIRHTFLFHPAGMRTPEVIKASGQEFFQQPCRCSTSLNASPYPVVILTVHIFFHTVTVSESSDGHSPLQPIFPLLHLLLLLLVWSLDQFSGHGFPTTGISTQMNFYEVSFSAPQPSNFSSSTTIFTKRDIISVLFLTLFSQSPVISLSRQLIHEDDS